MMRGRLIIDGLDAFTNWGVYSTRDCWNELIAYPPLKDVEYNDWHEYDGIEADLSDPKLKSRTVSVCLAYTSIARLADFLTYLTDTSLHIFNIASIGRTYKLRLWQAPEISMLASIGCVTLKLVDDFPMTDYEYIAPVPPTGIYLPQSDDYLIDGDPFNLYGACVLKGALSEIMQTPEVKENLTRDISTLNGSIYDDEGAVTFKEKEVKIPILMRSHTLANLWLNYDALLYTLIQPGERILTVERTGKGYLFIYKNCRVTKFYPTDKIWLQFDLTLRFI